MSPRNSLTRRIAGAYLLFALGSSLFIAIIAIIAVEGIEVHLVDNRLKEVAAWAVPRHAGGLPVAMPAGLSFYHGEAIPLSLRNLQEGVGEVHVDGIGLHVLAGKDAEGPFVVVDHESDYERVELVVYSMFVCGFVGILLFSLFLGGFIGRRAVLPITELAMAVRAGSARFPMLDRPDELGVLARAFATHTAELRGFLDRERYFTGDVSHELRTPLTIITGAAEILVQQHQDNPAIAAPADRILRAANEAADCVNVLLMLARSPAGLSQPVVDIQLVAEAETARYQPLVGAKPVRLVCRAGPGLQVRATPELCVAAIGNLIRNACQYTDTGEVLVHLDGNSISVDDTGPGLPDAVRAALSAKVGTTLVAGSAGTGLGLALVRRICEHLGATLTFRDREGGGSSFVIQFAVDLTKS